MHVGVSYLQAITSRLSLGAQPRTHAQNKSQRVSFPPSKNTEHGRSEEKLCVSRRRGHLRVGCARDDAGGRSASDGSTCFRSEFGRRGLLRVSRDVGRSRELERARRGDGGQIADTKRNETVALNNRRLWPSIPRPNAPARRPSPRVPAATATRFSCTTFATSRRTASRSAPSSPSSPRRATRKWPFHDAQRLAEEKHPVCRGFGGAVSRFVKESSTDTRVLLSRERRTWWAAFHGHAR